MEESDRPTDPSDTSGDAASGEQTPEAIAVHSLLAAVLPPEAQRLETNGLVGRGGMGSVLRVRDRGLERTVALKKLGPKSIHKTTWVAALIREARLTARLDHPCIVPIYEVGVREGGDVYYTMKLVEGEQLSRVVRRTPVAERSRSELLDLVDGLIRVCGAVAAAHAIGYVHCDIKPQNIMLGKFGAVYLMDWGGARAFGPARTEERRSTEARWLEGKRLMVRTPAFMAPEQARREPVTPLTDVFLLGSVLYFLLTAASPYGHPDVEVMRQRAAACEFDRPSEREPSVPLALEEIVLKAMAEDPRDRYPSALALADALKAYERGGGWEFPTANYEAGEFIIREGEVAHTAYVIIQGACEVLRGDQVLRTMHTGEVFGETAIFAGLPRTASVRALEPTRVGIVTRDIFERDVARWNPWMARFVETLAKRLADD